MTQNCANCRSTQSPAREPNPGGFTLTCRACGHTVHLDHQGVPYVPPTAEEVPPASTSHHITQYPLGLAVTLIELHVHTASVPVGDFHVTPPNPQTLRCYVFHLPSRAPITAFRATRPMKAADIRYIYAVETVPPLPEMPTRSHRALRTLIHQETQRVLGHNVKSAYPEWQLCPAGTVNATPLAPHP